MSRLGNLVTGKRVAVVGRAGSILGTGSGRSIDRADVVIRVNWLLPIPENQWPDVGKRTDLVYTCILCDTARKLADAEGVPWMRLSSRRRNRVTRRWFPSPAGWKASTGFVCVAHILKEKPKSISLYGFDLMRSEHFQPRNPDGNSPEGSRTGRWLHNWDLEGDAWRRLLKRARRVKPDAIFREALR